MSLRLNGSNEHADATNPWASGPLTIAFWIYRLGVITARFQTGLIDTDDANPESTGEPRVTIGTSTAGGNTIAGTLASSGSSSTDTSTETYTTSSWFHVALVVRGSGTTLTEAEVYINGVGTGSPVTFSRDITGVDVIRIGSDTTNFSNSDIAHYAYFGSELSGSQITELQTKLPSAITGATPVIYCPFLTDALNDGSGGATYDFTLSDATIDSTNDATLPALSGPSSSIRTQPTTGPTHSILTKGLAS